MKRAADPSPGGVGRGQEGSGVAYWTRVEGPLEMVCGVVVVFRFPRTVTRVDRPIGTTKGNPPMRTDVRTELLARLRAMPLDERSVMPETVADELGVTRRAVEEQLRRLETEGHITWHRKRRGGRRLPWYPITVNSTIVTAHNV